MNPQTNPLMDARLDIIRNPHLQGFRSLDGKSSYAIGDWFEGDPTSRREGCPTSLAATYSQLPASLPAIVGPMVMYGDWLPYKNFPSLGEGGTPLVALANLAKVLDVGSVLLKREAANPTGSHKDRMTPLVVARAIDVGARGLVCASSGNAAVSLAAYSAAAGVPCVVITTPSITDAYRHFLDRAGAEIIVVSSPRERWDLMAKMVADGWYPVTNYSIPAVGSNPWGVQGYKTVAYELWQQAGPLDAIVVPCSRGDLLWGIAEGYSDLQRSGLVTRSPALYAVEPFPRLSLVLTGRASVTSEFAGTTRQFSLGGDTVTDQAVRAVRNSRGIAVCVSDFAAIDAQKLAARHGVDLELGSAATLSAVATLREEGLLDEKSMLAVLGTAASPREPAAALPPLQIHSHDEGRQPFAG
ncbi:pyridoxal-phosphate dependent enzyme [Paraburkholderia sp. MM6662-R1]|uniref:pyridoxal-phosphate dependent enzyme n=1 Tax=Paraburkholderia sp. MM6662-R1 TaxID=2991066 RepID=UPI003D1D7A7D